MFALIALFVGSFLIFNTFSIVVAQRLRELALLRAVGAGRWHVAGSVLGEAFAVGILASIAGLGSGVGLAAGLRAMLSVLGLDIPSTGLVVSARTAIVCLVAGTLITVLASASPARRAATIPPNAAQRSHPGQPRQHGCRRWYRAIGAGLPKALRGLTWLVALLGA